MTREEWRKQKELDEQRKLGNAPAALDEEGREINPHIPQYITKLPFFYENTGPTLKHQRRQAEKIETFSTIADETRQHRGIKKGPAATRYRKGACANCGAISHKTRDCLERPRKAGAKFTGERIARDEHVPQQLNRSYDGKRDRYRNYDPREHGKVIEEYEKMEKLRREMKTERLEREIREQAAAAAAAAAEKPDSADASAPVGVDGGGTAARDSKNKPTAEESSDSEAEEEAGAPRAGGGGGGGGGGGTKDDVRYAETANMAGTKFDSKNRQTIRNLRIREDTAKYLLNLDVNSALYDAKTHSMRANPFEGREDERERRNITFRGDNFERYTGETLSMARKNVFAWQAAEKGADVHLQADPTKLELMHKEYTEKRETFESKQRDGILSKYGGQEHLEAPPRELLLAQTEHYVEYSRSGAVVKGQEKAKVLSRYEEDVHPGNHTSVWGSYWKDGQWGYACCHALQKQAYCTGEAGKRAQAESSDMMGATSSVVAGAASSAVAEETGEGQGQGGGGDGAAASGETAAKSLAEMHRDEKRRKRRDKRKAGDRSGDQSDDKEETKAEAEARKQRERHERIAKFMRKHKDDERRADTELAKDERSRSYYSGRGDGAAEVGEDEMEAYHLAKRNKDDPMARYL